jgi:hypothetical protein
MTQWRISKSIFITYPNTWIFGLFISEQVIYVHMSSYLEFLPYDCLLKIEFIQMTASLLIKSSDFKLLHLYQINHDIQNDG